MADQRTMAELLRAPTEGYAEAIVVPPIPAEHFELKHSLINLVTSKQFFARIWLDKDTPPRSILTWDDLVSKFINHFFPPSKTTNLRNEISNFQQRFDESFYEAWDRFKDLLRACPHHGFTELHQLDTFYNGLNPSDQDSLNSAAGGNLLERSAQDVLKIIENKSKVCNSRNKPIVSQVKASNVDSSEIASAVASAVTSAMTAMFKQHQVTPAPASVKAVEESCVTCGAAAVNYNQGNTRYRPQNVANQIRPLGFAQPNVQNNQTRYNQGYNQNRGIIQGNPNYQAPAYQALIHQPQVVKTNDFSNYMKANDTVMKNMQTQMTSLTNSNIELKNMFGQFMKMNTASTSGSGSLPSNIVANPRGDLKAITTRSGIFYDGPPIPPPFSCLAKVVKREPKVTKDTVLPSTENIQPSIVQIQAPIDEPVVAPKLKPSIPILQDHQPKAPSNFECLALADLGASINLMPLSIWKIISTPRRLTPYSNDPELCKPLQTTIHRIVERPFLRTAHALIDVYGEELTLRVDDEAVTFKVGQTSRYSYNDVVSINQIDVACEEYAQEVLRFSDSSKSGNPTLSLDPILSISSPSLTPFEEEYFILEEIEACLTNDSIPTRIDDDNFDSEGDLLLLEKLLNDDPSSPLPPKELHVEELKIDPWVSPVYCVPKKGGITVIENDDNELIPTRLVTGWRTRKSKRRPPLLALVGHLPTDMPFRFIVMLQARSKGHKISKSGIKVDKAKVDVIAKLPHLTPPMTHLLEKDTPFIFSKECIESFNIVKKKLTEAPILVAPDWDLLFEIMCDASDYAVGAVLGLRKTKHFQPIHYASKTMMDAQAHYTTAEKELLAVVYAFEKFQPYLVLSKTIVNTTTLLSNFFCQAR
ncbi:reverse transcriptase domain-containing protein [Tanacetum coccineum]